MRSAVSTLGRKGAKHARAHADKLGDWHDTHAEKEGITHISDDEDFHDIGGSE